MTAPLLTTTFSTPWGQLLLGCYQDQLCLCDWNFPQRLQFTLQRLQRHIRFTQQAGRHPILDACTHYLDQYCKGKFTIPSFPLLTLGTPFQQRVWQELLTLKEGEVISYSTLAARIHHNRATRAVASACKANAMSILIPCHRIITANGTTGQYGGGAEVKKALLVWESR